MGSIVFQKGRWSCPALMDVDGIHLRFGKMSARAVKPAASAAVSTSLWKSKGVTGLSISISGEGLHYAAEEEGGFAHLLALWKEGKTVTVKCFERENDASPYLEGPFVITQMERQAPAQDDTSYSIQLENAGAPTTLDETKIS